jgi:hypothetical protein
MELVAATIADDVVEVTLSSGDGLLRLEGSPEEIVALCAAMDEVAVLAGASSAPEWLHELPVGADVVRLGVGHGRVRFITGPMRP